ncbi:F-box only protein 33 [Drosophila mauritiana]|uniref:F-box only protein 33 n=1 Tax=Drosophila mauritiana TaxID=7226 RepID=A0A6P8JQN5_DROMA|nr:F-box only protein 33 [Drosophila mauritiana]
MNFSQRQPEWHTIPSVALSHIFDYLNPQDRRSAAGVCFSWRHAFFQKRYFRNFRFQLDVGCDDQLAFFHRSMANLARELIVVFDFQNAFHIQKMRHLLYKVARCDNIQKLRFQTHNVGLVAIGNMQSEHLLAIEQCFVEPLTLILSRKRQPCQLLDLGAIEALSYYGHDFLNAMGKPQELLQLTLASIKYDPSHYPILSLDSTLLQKCAALQVLSLDYDTLSDELLHTIQVLPLRKLLIAVHGLDSKEYPDVSETAWSNFSDHFSSIELVLTLVYAYEAIALLQHRVLRRNMPITHVRLLFCEKMNAEALDWMSLHYKETLRSIHYVDAPYKYSNRMNQTRHASLRQDPFVMMAWRCKRLEEIVVHGYLMDPHNLVGIARLLGRQLKRLEVSMIDWSGAPLLKPYDEEISTILGQQWQPISLDKMPPSLYYDNKLRDQFVYEMLRQDLSQ